VSSHTGTGIALVSGYRRPNNYQKKHFSYDPEKDGYVCPAGECLSYSATERNGYWYYAAVGRYKSKTLHKK
jgi:hypothetical protein